MRHTWPRWRVRCRHPVEWDQIVSDHDQDDLDDVDDDDGEDNENDVG